MTPYSMYMFNINKVIMIEFDIDDYEFDDDILKNFEESSECFDLKDEDGFFEYYNLEGYSIELECMVESSVPLESGFKSGTNDGRKLYIAPSPERGISRDFIYCKYEQYCGQFSDESDHERKQR